MCGIAGFGRFHFNEGDDTRLKMMGEAIAHRGPDSSGTYIDDAIGLCHRRLSIIDLSPAGNQPMFSSDRKFVIVFNGEIYNFLELREELVNEGHQFNSHSDTEVILALYAKEGANCVKRLNGMFAFALWDIDNQVLFIARDRLGKKPLYYFDYQGRFAFASEIKALLTLDDVPKELRLDAVHDFFAYQYVPDPKSIFKHIHKLPAGHTMTVTDKGIEIEQYWDISFANTSTASEESHKEELKALLTKTTRQRMISDVPLGAFLSGGVDSSGVVALMATEGENQVKTCTIGFDDEKFNEAEFAKEIADKYNTEHHEFMVNQQVEARLEEIVGYFDEPFADPSLVPTFYVSELARQAVTVAVAGDGGDEMFAGYEKYTTDDIENRLRRYFPEFLRKNLFPSLAKLAGTVNLSAFKKAKSLLTSLSYSPAMGFYFTNSHLPDALWQSLANEKTKQALGNYHPSELTVSTYNNADGPDHLSRILYTDIKTYLCGGILVKVDRMSMANSLEVRAPILDYQVAEFAAKLPSAQKYNKGEKKYLLKEVFKPFIPKSLLYRKKMGFSVPLATWLREDLKDIAEKYIITLDTGIHSFFNRQQVENLWHQHQSAKYDHSAILWSMLMFQMWYAKYVETGPQQPTVQ